MWRASMLVLLLTGGDKGRFLTHADPREFKRMQVELRLAREKIKAEALLLTRRTL